MNLYETLGVKKDAGPGEIKSAYRKKAKENHPDAGGDKGTFQDISRAYGILSNPEKKDHYDRTGESEAPNEDQIINGELVKIFNSIVESNSFNHEHEDVFKEMRKIIDSKSKETKDSIENAKRLLSKFNAILKRIEKGDLFRGITKQKIADIESLITSGKKNIELYAKIKERIYDNVYRVDQRSNPDRSDALRYAMGGHPQWAGRSGW